MEYVGVAVKTALSIVSFLAEERHREDQDTASFLTRSTMAENKSRFVLVNIFGSPKYFPTPPSLVIPRLCFTKSQVAYGVLTEREMEDLSPLIDCPEAES